MKIKEYDDRMGWGGKEKHASMVTLVLEDDEGGQTTIQVRPWNGSIEIRCEGRDVSITDYAIEPLIRAIRKVVKERDKANS